MNNYERLIREFYRELGYELRNFTLPADELIRTLDFVEIGYTGESVAGIAGLREGHSLFMIVKNQFQNRGIGQQLLQRVLHRAQRNGYHYVQLTVYKDNQSAVHIYKKHGFRIISAVKTDNRDAFYMVKPLSWKGHLFVPWCWLRALLRWGKKRFEFELTMSTLKKLVIFRAALTVPGGAERLLLEEERYFRERGMETLILTFSFDQRALYNYQPKKLKALKVGHSKLKRVLALRRTLQQITPDLIIGSSSNDAVYLYLATMFTSIPYIVHIHGTLFWFDDENLKYALIHRKVFDEIRNSVAGHKEFIPPRFRGNLGKRLIAEVLAVLDYLAVRKAKKIIVLTDQIKWEVKKLYGKEAMVARGCLPPEVLSYHPKQDIKTKLGLENKRVIFSVGRLDPRKRIDLLLKAFSKITSRCDDVYLVIGGIGSEKERLENLTRKLGIMKKTKFVGFIPEKELLDYYATCCDVFAFPSWTTSGITPYEALAMGKKVVWTSEADEPILNDKHVFLADPNVEDFARALEEALNTKVGGKLDLSGYTWDNYFETVYVAAREVHIEKQA